MSVTTNHFGPWSAEEALEIDDDGGNRFEVIDGSLYMTPAPSYEHQQASSRLWAILHRAAQNLDTVGIAEGVNVVMPNGLNIPDLVVVNLATVDSSPIKLTPANVACAIEIESPSSRRIDRVLKPSVYAEAGIPMYWRVELDPVPTVSTYTLNDGVYLPAREVTARSPGHLSASLFTVLLDPVELIENFVET